MRRSLITLLLAAVLAAGLLPAAPRVASAQGHRIPRRLLFAVGGAVAGATAGASYLFFNGQSQPGSCGSRRCVLSVTVLFGGLLGFIIGHEFDELYALHYRGGSPLHPDFTTAPLTGEPTLLAIGDSMIAVGGGGGVQLFGTSGRSFVPEGKRAAGVRGIAALGIAEHSGALALGSLSGLYLYPPVKGAGTLVSEGDVTAAVTSGDHVFFGTGNRVEIAPLSADTTRLWPGMDVGGPAHDLEFDAAANVLWVVTDRELIALRPTGDSLSRLGAAPLDAPGRRLTIDGGRAAVAAGESGVRLFDITRPEAPVQTSTWLTARFAYDVSLVGSRLFVAAGPEGLYVLNVSGISPIVVGLAREVGFAAALVSRGRYTYILDRSSTSLRRIVSTF